MTYDRDEVVASTTHFYTFLTTHLHFCLSELKIPPPEGWFGVTADDFTSLQKSDTVIDLLQHLPYLPGNHGAQKWIYANTVCADYSFNSVKESGKLPSPAEFRLNEEMMEECPWEKYQDRARKEHIISLGQPEASLKGCFIFLDTLDGEVVVWDVMDVFYSSYESAGEFFAWLREQYETLQIFPVPSSIPEPSHLKELDEKSEPGIKGFKDFVRSLGWPPMDESGWDRDKAMKEIERVWPEYQ